MTGWLGPEEWQAVALSLKVSFWATVLSLPVGLLCALALLAYALFRLRFERIEVEPLAQVPAPPIARSGQG